LLPPFLFARKDDILEKGFYFLKNEYFRKFKKDTHIMENKEGERGRPYFYIFNDSEEDKILWAVPISSKCGKFEAQYKKNLKRYGNCDTIMFTHLKGKKAALLIQNMCPVTYKYVEDAYIDDISHKQLSMSNSQIKELEHKCHKVLGRTLAGKGGIFVDVKAIKEELIHELREEKHQSQNKPSSNFRSAIKKKEIDNARELELKK
jgi:hypothetical protein